MNTHDILLLEEQLSEEELSIQNTARDYCQSELMPRILEANRNETFDKNIYKEMGQLGFLGAPIKGYGCAGVNYVSYGLIAREIERVDSSYRSAYSVQTSLAMHAIHKFGSEEQKNHYLPEMAKGNLIGCFGLTEPDAGSDPGSMKTNAKKSNNGYILNGSKTWITNSPIADVLIIWAKDEQGILRGFIVDRNSKGLSTPKLEGKFSLRASTTGQIFLDDVYVGEDKILPEVQSFRGPFSCLNMARYGIAWGSLGAAEFCFNASLEYTKEREQFSQPISNFQVLQHRMVDMFIETELTKSLMIKATLQLDSDDPDASKTISALKVQVGKAGRLVGQHAVQLHGGMGVSNEMSIGHYLKRFTAIDSMFGNTQHHINKYQS